MISFYPGPSKVSDKIVEYFSEAYSSGILSANHRSSQFMDLISETNTLLKNKLDIPDDYEIFYTSSATECWQIIAQSFNGTNYHFYNGAFGEKWFHSTKKIKSKTIGYKYDLNKELRLGELDLSMEDGVICITQNETSNGTKVSNQRISKIRKQYPDQIIAADATSSLAGAFLQIANADIWYASVQKCFGLPAGLAVLICSPKAINKAKLHGESRHYNSLINIINNMLKCQTTHTPNVANIFLLNRVMSDRNVISRVSNTLEKRASCYYDLLDSKRSIKVLADKSTIRSTTVITVTGKADLISDIKKNALNAGFILGNGYGEFKSDTFRIANFPAITNKEVNKLLSFLDENLI